MQQLSGWVGAGVLTAGVSAALIAGAGAASAATGAGSDTGGATAAGTKSPDAGKSEAGGKHRKRDAQKDDDQQGAKPRAHRERAERVPRHAAPDAAPDTAVVKKLSAPPDTVRTARPVANLVKNLVTNHIPAQDVSSLKRAVTTPPAASVLGAIEGVVSSAVANIGSAAFNTVQSLETVVTGPPVVPPGSKVTVHTSTIQLDNGETVPANWYFPETTDGAPPKQMILLQHGFLAQGPMYSYTAAALAESTDSVVVTPTLSSNPFAGDDYWLGGSGMAASIGDLFEGNRTALTDSALAAGYGEAYDFPVGAPPRLPQKFALMGHSLGANLVSGAAGTLATDCDETSCAADDLVGVILLDGVPMGNTLPDALDELDAKQTLTGYIPVREIGAPLNAWNSLSPVNEQLTAARPGEFNGIVLDGGVHSDAMSGGNPLIQFALYVAAGFPEPQNPPAVQDLSAEWLNEWFASDPVEGNAPEPGTTVDVDTPNGTAHGVVIGSPPPFLIGLFHALVAKLEMASVTNIPSANPTLVRLAA
jgi:hypothetical protein